MPSPLTLESPTSAVDAADKHLETKHLLNDMGRRALSGGVVTGAAQALKFSLNLLGVIALARLLSPQDFGMVAMAGALMPILRTFREGGLSTATVQREGITHAQVSNLFWINLVLGAVIAAIGAALAPAVAWFYHDSRLAAMTVLLSLSFLLSGSAVQHLALLNRQMRFLAVAGIDVGAATSGFIAGLIMAWRGFGYWSLVGMQLTTTAAEVLLTWTASGWRPQLPRHQSETRSLLHFGASMTMYIFLRRLAAAMDVVLLGRYYGAASVGIYTRGSALLLRPLDQFINPFDTVFIPILSRLQNDTVRYREVFLQVYSAIALASFTLAGILTGASKPLVLVLLGQKWTEVIPIFSWLTIAALHLPLSYAAMWLLSTQGRSRDLVLIGIVVPSITVLSIAAGLPFGAKGLAISLSLMGVFIRMPIQYHITGRSGPVSRRDLFGVFLRHLPIWIIGAAATGFAQHLASSLPSLVQLIVACFAGLATAAVVIGLSPALRAETVFIVGQLQRFRRRDRPVLASG